MIEALCQDNEFQAMARGNSGRGTSIGPMALDAGDKKARPAPNSTAMAKIGHSVVCPDQARKPRAAAQTMSTPMAAVMIILRSWRSAVSPAVSAKKNSGMNWARPTMPSKKAPWPSLCPVSRARV